MMMMMMLGSALSSCLAPLSCKCNENQNLSFWNLCGFVIFQPSELCISLPLMSRFLSAGSSAIMTNQPQALNQPEAPKGPLFRALRPLLNGLGRICYGSWGGLEIMQIALTFALCRLTAAGMRKEFDARRPLKKVECRGMHKHAAAFHDVITGIKFRICLRYQIPQSMICLHTAGM